MSARSKLIGVLVAGGLIAVMVGVIALQMLSGPTRRTVKLDPSQVATLEASGEAPAIPAKPEGEWLPKFRAVYSLADGQTVKHVPKPFIPERLEFYRARMHAAQVQAIPRGPDFYLLDYDGNDFKMRTAWFGEPDVRGLFGAVLGIESTRLLGPDAILGRSMAGDIVLRKGSGLEENRGPFVAVVSDAFGRRLMLEQQTLDRDAVVIAGRLKLRAPSAGSAASVPAPTTQELARRRRMGIGNGPVLRLFVGKPKGDGWTQTGGTNLVRQLEQLCQMPVVVEGDVGGANVPFEVDSSVYALYQRRGGQANTSLLDEFLKNIADQTELTFKRETRPVETWVLTDHGPTTAPASGGASTLPAARRALR